LKETKKKILVVGAVILKEGKILCAQRPKGKTLGGYWEFPGGKIEAGETPIAALRRELVEELLVEIKEDVQEIITASYEYDFGHVTMTTFLCHLKDEGKDPVLLEHDQIKWLAAEELSTLEWAPVDIPTISWLQSERSTFQVASDVSK